MQDGSCAPPTVLARLSFMRLLSLLQDENQVEGAKIWYMWGNLSKNMDGKKDFQDAFQKWHKHWDQCVRSQGNNFEGEGTK
jgi:hypothetical protein